MMAGPIFASSPNRWLIAAASCLMQAALGSVYAASVFRSAIVERYAASEQQVSLAFTLTILALGVTAGFGGALQRRLGPRRTGTLGGLLYGAGICLAAIAPNLPLLYVTQGLIAGFGAGAALVGPLATAMLEQHGLRATLLILGAGYLAISVGAAQLFRAAPE